MTYPNEIEHETELIRRGRQKAIKEMEAKERKEYYSQTTSGRWTLQDHYMPFAEAIEEVTANAKYKVTSRNINGCCEIRDNIIKEQINPHGALYLSSITLRTIVDSYTASKKMMTAIEMARRIGKAVEAEVAYQEIQRVDEEIAATARKFGRRKHSLPRYRTTATKHATRKQAKQKGIELREPWANELISRVGLYLLEVFHQYGGIEYKNIHGGKKQKKYVFADRFIQEIEQNERLVLDRAIDAHPLIDIPKDWETTNEAGRYNTTGGYHLPQVRKRKPLLRNAVLGSVYGEKTIAMLNTLQQTAWRIDNRVLDVARSLVDKRFPVGSFKVCEFDRPTKGNAPQHIADDPELLKTWRRDRAKEHETYTNKTFESRRTRDVLQMATEYEHKTFYLSWSCDWRGRFYAQQSWLHFASTEFERSLLRFRDGCKLDDDSLYWCKAAIGAAYLGTSGSFSERVRWTEDNQALIRRIAENPVGTVYEWESAHDPWQFLQLCFEWNDVRINKTVRGCLIY